MAGGHAAGRGGDAGQPPQQQQQQQQYRVLVNDRLIAGQPVRAGTGSAEYLVRVPENAEAGDSFVFTATEEDRLTTSGGSTNHDNHDETTTTTTTDPLWQPPRIIETAVLEKKKSFMERVRGILPQLQHELEVQVLCQRNRTVLILLVFSLSLGSGFVMGTLLVTPESACAAAGTATT